MIKLHFNRSVSVAIVRYTSLQLVYVLQTVRWYIRIQARNVFNDRKARSVEKRFKGRIRLNVILSGVIKNLKNIRVLNGSILDAMEFSIGWFIETRNYLKRRWIVNRHPNYERGLRRARGLGQWNLIVGRTQTWSPAFGPQPLLHALLPFSCEQTKECLYAALYTPSASKGLPRSVGTLDYNPTTVVGLGPRLGSSLHRCKNSFVCTFVSYIRVYDC